jgi:hypothetical protein
MQLGLYHHPQSKIIIADAWRIVSEDPGNTGFLLIACTEQIFTWDNKLSQVLSDTQVFQHTAKC